jgi:hypothetical protein
VFFSRAEEIWPAIRDFKPDLLILSSGFDAHEADPLALIYLTDEDYAWVTEGSLKLADELCAGRVVCYVFGSTRAVCAEPCLRNRRSDGFPRAGIGARGRLQRANSGTVCYGARATAGHLRIKVTAERLELGF